MPRQSTPWLKSVFSDQRIGHKARLVAQCVEAHAVNGVATIATSVIADQSGVLDVRGCLLVLRNHHHLTLGHTEGRKQSVITLLMRVPECDAPYQPAVA